MELCEHRHDASTISGIVLSELTGLSSHERE
jgi:hypothetical protein